MTWWTPPALSCTTFRNRNMLRSTGELWVLLWSFWIRSFWAETRIFRSISCSHCMRDSFVSLLDLPGQRQPLHAVVCPSLTAVIQAQVFAGLSLFSSDRCYHCAGNCHSSSGLIVCSRCTMCQVKRAKVSILSWKALLTWALWGEIGWLGADPTSSAGGSKGTVMPCHGVLVNRWR